MDLTAYVEKHEFCFDAVLDERVTNDEVKSFVLLSSSWPPHYPFLKIRVEICGTAALA